METPPLVHKKGFFECPICHSEVYHHVVAKRSDGKARATALYQCGGCSVSFTDPLQFTQCTRVILQKRAFDDCWYPVPAAGGPSAAYKDLPTEKLPRKPPREPGADR